MMRSMGIAPNLHALGVGVLASPSANWWETGGGIAARQVLQAIGAASLNASLLDLSGNGNNGAASLNVSLPSWNATDGWVFSGGTKAIMTGMLPAPTWSFIARFSSFVSGSYLMGSGGPFYLINPDIDGSNERVGWGEGLESFSPNVNSGVIAIAGRTLYYNGIPIQTLGVATDSASYQVAIGCLNFNDVDQPVGGCDGKIEAVAFYADTLTDAQVLAKSTALAALH